MGRHFRLVAFDNVLRQLPSELGRMNLSTEILQPVAVLIAWALIMLVWTVCVRLPAMKRAGIDINKVVGGRPGGLDGVIDDKAQWPAHNYIHLMEQPTIFYAAAMLLALVGAGHGLNAMIAWAYVGLRIIHSLIQATNNIIRFRFLAFALSTLCMIALSLHALIAVFSVHGV
jgi:hypothetical protein